MDDQVILEIQHALRTISFYDSRLLPIVVDGFYGPETERAVTIFQRLYDLPPTGQVDYDTWERLRDTLRSQTPPLLPLEAFPHPRFLLRPGETDELTAIVQAMIRVLASRYSNIHSVSLTGIYDSETVEAIRRLQAMYGLEENGIIDATTWNELATLFNRRNDTVKG